MKIPAQSVLSTVAALALFIATSLILFFLLRDVLPSVLQDELIYLENSKRDVANYDLPNAAYFKLYSLTELFGDNFYTAGKALNHVFSLLTTLVIYFWLLRRVRPVTAVLIGLSFQVSAFAMYGSFFMPEPMYAFFVIVSILFFYEATSAVTSKRLFLFCMSGAGLGAAMLVKPHALIILIAVGLYLPVGLRAAGLKEKLIGLAAIIASFLGMRLVLGLVIGGWQTLDFFAGYISESTLTNVVEKSAQESDSQLFTAVMAMLGNSLQHFALIIFLAFPALVAVVSHRRGSYKFTTMVLFVLFITSLFIAAFEVYVTVFQGDDHLSRVLLRHYEYLVPLLWAGLGIGLSRGDEKFRSESFSSALSVFALCIVFLGISLASEPLWGASRYSDSGFTTFLRNPVLMWTYVLGNFGFASLLMRRKRPTPSWVASVALAISLLGGAGSIQTVRIENLEPYPSDLAALQIRKDYPDLEGSEILLVTTNKTLAQAGAFLINKEGIELFVVGSGSTILEKDMPRNFSLWVQFPGVTIVTNQVPVFSKDGAIIYDASKPLR